MTELYKNAYMVTSADADLVSLVWSREEPDDEHAAATAQAITVELSRFADAHPGQRIKFLLDLSVVSRTFPRATAGYASWMLGNRSRIKGVAFCTRSFLLRAGVSAALLVPGLKVKGFKDPDAARVFLATF